MTCQVIVEFEIKPDCIDNARNWIRNVVGDHRAFEGCVSLTITQDQDDRCRFLMVEQWDSREHYQKYYAWRAETGTLDDFVGFMEGEPRVRYFDYTGL